MPLFSKILVQVDKYSCFSILVMYVVDLSLFDSLLGVQKGHKFETNKGLFLFLKCKVLEDVLVVWSFMRWTPKS